MAAPVILIEAWPRVIADGTLATVRLAGGGGELPIAYGGVKDWRAGVEGLPKSITSLDFDGTDVGTGGVPQAAELVWRASSQAALDIVAGYYWADAAITVRIGPEDAGGALPPIALTGTVLDAVTEPGLLRISMADPAAAAKKALLGTRPDARFGGTGGIDGPADWSGTLKHRVWGRVWNKKGDPIDAPNNIYCFADPGRPILWFDAVRDRGAPASALVFLAWQGSAAATLTALRAATAPQGGGVFCPSIACVKWWTQPGTLTADLRGEVGTGYVETAPEIAAALIAEMAALQALGLNTSVPTFAAGTVAAAKAARPAAAGLVVKDDTTTAASLIEKVLGDVSLLWVMEASGTIRIRAWEWGSPVASLRSQQVTRKQVFRPVLARRNGYLVNQTQMARGDLAGIVLVTDYPLPDGVAQLPDALIKLGTIEAGADKTSENTAAAIAGQGDLATKSTIGGADMIYGALGRISLYNHQVDFIINEPGGTTPATSVFRAFAGVGITSAAGDPVLGHFAFVSRTIQGTDADIYVRVVRVSDGTVIWGGAGGVPIAATGAFANIFLDTTGPGQRQQYDVQAMAPAGNAVVFRMRAVVPLDIGKTAVEEIQIAAASATAAPGAGSVGGGVVNGSTATTPATGQYNSSNPNASRSGLIRYARAIQP